MPEAYVTVEYPDKGLDLSAGFGAQRPLTTVLGQNVLSYEPVTDRQRGGTRPGLVRYVSEQVPAGEHLIQHLNVVIMHSGDALLDNFDNDPPDGDEDPSSPGPASSWGSGSIATDVFDGSDITGQDEHSRNPGGPGSVGKTKPRKRRKGGNAIQPNKNTVTEDKRTAGPPPPAFLFTWTMAIEIHVNPTVQDVFHDDGQQPAFVGSECRQYQPPNYPSPSGDQDGAMGCRQIAEQIEAYMANLTSRNHEAGFSGSFSWTYVSSGVSGPFASCTHVGGTD